LDAAGLCDVGEQALLRYRIDYSLLGKLQNLARQGGLFAIKDAAYSDSVVVTLTGPSESADALITLVADLSAGTGTLLSRETERVPLPR
jgi:putative IMPACT (imprinted ancient) family translation regulator